MSFSLFENEQCSISLSHVTWVEKKRDGAVNVHFPGADIILMNKHYGPAFLEAFQHYHNAKQAQTAAAGSPSPKTSLTAQEQPTKPLQQSQQVQQITVPATTMNQPAAPSIMLNPAPHSDGLINPA